MVERRMQASSKADGRCTPCAIDLSEIHGKRLAMIAWGETATGDDEVVVFTGLADWDAAVLTMRREPPKSSFVVPAQWLARIRPVSQDLKEMLLGADYYFSVTIGSLPDSEDSSLYKATGLKWLEDADE